MPQEVLEFSVNPTSALKALADINQAIVGNESKFTSANKNIEQSFTKVQDTLLKLTDRSYAANERYVQSLERQAAAIGKTNVEKLIQERDKHIAKLGAEEAQIKRVTAAYDKLIAAESNTGGNKFQAFGESVKEFVENPMKASGTAATGLLEKIGPVGVAFGVVAGAAVAVGAGLFEITKRAGESAEQLTNLAASSGININELDKLQAMAKITGIDISSLARAGTALATALEGGGEKAHKMEGTLEKLGVSAYDFNGKLREEGEILPEVLKALSNVSDQNERMALASDALGSKVAKNLQPLILKYGDLEKAAKALGYGNREELIKSLDEGAESMHKFGLAFDIAEGKVAGWTISLVKAIPIVKDLRAVLEQYNNWNAKLEPPKWMTPPSPLPDIAKGNIPEAQRFNNASQAEDRIKANIKRLEEERDTAQRVIDAAAEGHVADRRALLDAEKTVTTKNAGIEADKQRLKLADDLKKAREEADAFALKGDEREANAVEKIQLQYEKLYAVLKKTGASKTELLNLTNEALRQERNALIDDTEKLQKMLDKDAVTRKSPFAEDIKEGLKANEKNATDRIKYLAGIRSASIAADNAQMSLDEAQELGSARLTGKAGINAAQLTGKPDAVAQAQLDAEFELLQIKKKYANEHLQVELKLAEEKHLNDGQLEQVTKDLRLKNAKEVYDIELQQAEALADKQAESYRRHFDEIKNESAKLYETLFTHPADFGKQLQDTLKQAAVKPIVDRLSNATATILTGKQQHSPIQATEFNTTATDRNTMATYALVSVLANRGGSVGGGTSSVGGGGRSFTLLGGGSSGASSVGGPSFTILGGGNGSTSGGGGFSLGSATLGSGTSGGSDTGGFSGSTASSTPSSGGFSYAGIPGLNGSIATPSFVPGGGGSSGSTAGGFFHAALDGVAGGIQKGDQGGSGLHGFLKSIGIGTSPGGDGVNPQVKKASGFFGFGSGGLFSVSRKSAPHTGTPSTTQTATGSGETPTEGNGTETGAETPNQSGEEGKGAINGVGGLAGNLLQETGTYFAEKGLLGDDRGTGKGVLEGTIGGAEIGMKYGGPIGAAVGAAVGLGIGVGEVLAGVESPMNKVKRIAREKYGVTISTALAKNLVELADQKYGKSIPIMMQSSEVRDMLELYAAGTGQKMPLSATKPLGGSLVEQGGQLEQQATYKYGNAYTFQSNLPIAGGMPTTNYNYSTPGGGNQPMSLNIAVNGQGAGQFLAGSVVTPDFVQAQWSSAQQASNGRLNNSALYAQPGLIVS